MPNDSENHGQQTSNWHYTLPNYNIPPHYTHLTYGDLITPTYGGAGGGGSGNSGASSAPGGMDDLNRQIQKLRREVAELDGKLSTQIQKVNDQSEGLKKRNHELETEGKKIAMNLEKLERKADEGLKKIVDAENKATEALKKIADAESRSIQIVGILTAVIALVLVSTDISKSADHVFSAFVIFLTATFSLILFACLLQLFFGNSKKTGWIALLAILSFASICGTGIYLFNHISENSLMCSVL